MNASGILDAHVNTAGLAMPVSRAAGLGPNPKIEPFMDRL